MHEVREKKSNGPEVYNEDYFERGSVLGISCYSNYHWMPELTLKMAYTIIKTLSLKDHDRVLDFGCAKGFVVKALRVLNIDAYGCDFSTYAIDNVDSEARNYCRLSNGQSIPFEHEFEWIFAKDVLEHLVADELAIFLKEASAHAKNLFIIVPLGKNGKYNAPPYEQDVTHRIAEDPVWWTTMLENNGWRVVRWCYRITGIKDNWAQYENGNGFFIATRKE